MRSLSPLAVPTLAALNLLLACQPAADPGAARTTEVPTPESEEAPVRSANAWSGVLGEVESSGIPDIKIKRPDSNLFEALSPGSPVPAGSIVRTGPGTRAKMRLDDNQGSIALNHSSEMTMRWSNPGIDLKSGHAIVTTSEDPKLKKGLPEITLPTGSVELLGTRVSALASPEESSVMVAHGKVRARLKAGQELQAQFGQELVLPKARPARVDAAPDLERTFGWSEIQRRDESLPTLEQGMGKLVARPAGGGPERRLNLSRHKIRVRIQGMMAYTEITETFYNPSSQELEGLYRFPLPENAQISRLALKVGDKIMEGQFLETARAERIWRDILTTRRDPALLKWKQGNQFELRIFPILARDSRQVTIGYVQRLEPTGDGYRYTYPMPVDRSGQSHTKHFDFKATLKGHDSSAPLELEGYSGAMLEPVANQEDVAEMNVTLKRKDFQPSGDLSLRFGLKPEAQELRTYTYTDRGRAQDDSYMVVSLRPQFGKQPEVVGRDFVVVLDNSYSSRGLSLKLQRELAARLIEEMDPMDQVRVLACAHRCQSVGPKAFQLARSGLAAELRNASAGLTSSGSTNPIEALRTASRVFDIRDSAIRRVPHVIYITDGIASAGAVDPGHIQDAARRLLEPLKARMSVVHMGGESDASNLKALARAGRGAVIKLSAGSSMTGNALRVLRHHYGVSMRDIAVELPPGVERVYPTSLSSLLPGDELLLVGRYKGDIEGRVKLRGYVAGRKIERAWPMHLSRSKVSGNSFAPRLWAKHRIEDLELQGPDQRREIIRLSKRYGILTRHTTLLALESEEMMREFNVRRQRHIDWKGKEGAKPEETSSKTTSSKAVKNEILSHLGATGGGTRDTTKSLEDTFTGSSGVEKNLALDGDADSIDDLSDQREETEQPKTLAPAAKPSKKTRSKRAGPLSKDNKPMDPSRNLFDKNSERRKADLGNKVGKKKEQRVKGRGGVGKGMLGEGRLSGSYRTYRQCHEVVSPFVSKAAEPTRAEERRIESRRKAHERDPRNRTRRMRYIRALMRGDAPHREDAKRQIAAWLETNAMDSEAVVLQSQVLLNEGRVEEALEWLTSAADAAARAKWLQTRVHKAYRALGDEAMACAAEVTLADLKFRANPTRRDILACPSATPDSALIPQESRRALPMARPMQSLRGKLIVTAEWSSAVDLDIVLVEPNGRLLSWLSQRKRVSVSGVRSTGFEQLAMPRAMPNGTSVRLVRVGNGSDPIPARVTIKHGDVTKTLDVTIFGQTTEVAELGKGWKSKCRSHRVWEHGFQQPTKRKRATLKFGTLESVGALDRDAARRVTRRNARKFQNCYERTLAKNPKVKGSIIIGVQVGQYGRVQTAKVQSRSIDIQTASCLTSVFKRLRFPPTSSGDTTLRVPMAFRRN